MVGLDPELNLPCPCSGSEGAWGEAVLFIHLLPPAMGPTATKASISFQWIWTLVTMTVSSFFVEVVWPAKKFQQISIRVSQDVRISQMTLLLAPSTLFLDPSGVLFLFLPKGSA